MFRTCTMCRRKRIDLHSVSIKTSSSKPPLCLSLLISHCLPHCDLTSVIFSLRLTFSFQNKLSFLVTTKTNNNLYRGTLLSWLNQLVDVG